MYRCFGIGIEYGFCFPLIFLVMNLLCIRLLCTLEGKILIQENCADMRGGSDSLIEHDEIQSFNFSCAVPDVIGRGFIEVVPLWHILFVRLLLNCISLFFALSNH